MLGRRFMINFISMHTNREGEVQCRELAGLLLSHTRQIALGMLCLQMKQFIHRDLAARNVLVTQDGLCKVHVGFIVKLTIMLHMHIHKCAKVGATEYPLFLRG